ncbi:MAG TPA: TlpA disulfide reductase family protein [Oligoflexus sp.]|uniref:TlpA family protein disulfide reductase n=1 Tax=Oligoflexus sp. TaxID=1971216 RepID=UPI002D7F620A|nr:TlpA disulfide reductase family protein [Oligoflexus sp.]HET9239130.1 TlpA disulfide reductase family protein [Oligoflexus sp.]
MSATLRLRILCLLTLLMSCVTTGSLEAATKPRWPNTFSLVSLDGKKVLRSASDFKGQPLLVQFWASWCRSCSGISSELERVVLSHQTSHASRLQFLSVSIDETTDEARGTVIQRPSTFLTQHAYHDHQQHLRTSLKVESVPTIVLIHRDGTILLRKEGHLSASEYLAIKDALSGLSSSI